MTKVEKSPEQKLAASQSTFRSLAKRLLPEPLLTQVLAALPPEKSRGRKKKVQP